MIVGLLLLVAASTVEDPVCQELGVPQKDGSVVPTLMCKGADNRWRPANPTTEERNPDGRSAVAIPRMSKLPRRAEVTYEGSFESKSAKSMQMPTRFTLNSIMSSVSQAQGKSMQGALTLVAVFNGDALTAQGSGTGGLRAGRLSGLVEGDHCHLITDDQTMVYDGECGPKGFTGRITAGPRNRENVSGTFRLSATKLVDVAERERQQALAAADTARARAAAVEAERARIASLPAAGPVFTARLATQVQTDSRGWAFNHFDGGSLHNVKVSSGSIKSGNFVLRGEYTYNGGSPGWVLAQYAGGKFDCIQFWDAMVGCRGLRTEADGQMMRGALFSAVTDSGNSSSSSGGVQFDQERWNKSVGLNADGTMPSQH